MKKLHPKSDEILGNSIKQITHQGGKEGKKKKRTQVRTKRTKPRMDHKKAPKQIMSQSPQQSQ
jgi:hypothetical protein